MVCTSPRCSTCLSPYPFLCSSISACLPVFFPFFNRNFCLWVLVHFERPSVTCDKFASLPPFYLLLAAPHTLQRNPSPFCVRFLTCIPYARQLFFGVTQKIYWRVEFPPPFKVPFPSFCWVYLEINSSDFFPCKDPPAAVLPLFFQCSLD